MVNIMCIIFDKNDKHYEGINLIGVILSINFILFVWQTIAFSFRLYEVRNNKIDMKIMDGDYVFKGEPIEVIYKDLKKILNKTNGGFKLYCKGNDGKNHHCHSNYDHSPRKNGGQNIPCFFHISAPYIVTVCSRTLFLKYVCFGN